MAGRLKWPSTPQGVGKAYGHLPTPKLNPQHPYDHEDLTNKRNVAVQPKLVSSRTAFSKASRQSSGDKLGVKWLS